MCICLSSLCHTKDKDIYGFAVSCRPFLLSSGIKQYIEESCHIRIEDERLVLDDLTTNEADVIVQFALFGETKF